MTDEDLFFTHTIVGRATSVELGRPLDRKSAGRQALSSGVQVSLSGQGISLADAWKDWCVVQGTYPYPGRPRRRPGGFRRWLERHSLVLAVSGAVLLLLSVGFLVVAMKSQGLVGASWLAAAW